MRRELILYTGPGCGLCEKAKLVIEPVLPTDWQLLEVDISASDSLCERYGVRIPVVAVADGREKGWPFTAGQVRRLFEEMS